MLKEINSTLDKKNKKLTSFLIFLFFIIAPLFIFKAYINANSIGGSVDYPQFYYLSQDFWSGKDIFSSYQDKKGMPMWNHLLYIIFYPYTLFSLNTSKIIWFFSNIFFAGIIILQLKKAYNLSINKTLVLALLTFSSTPFTNTLGNGQLGLFLLMSLLLYWYSKSNFKSIFLSIAYIKFSFAPFFLINSLFKKEIDLIFAIIISLLAIFFYSLYLEVYEITQFLNPLLTILSIDKTVFIGDGHNFHIRSLFAMIGLFEYYFIFVVLIGTLNLINIFFIKKNDLLFLIITISSLFIFYHNYYDLVFLIPLAGYLLKSNISKQTFMINFPVVLFFFYFVRFNELVLENYFSTSFINYMGSFLLLISYFSLSLDSKIKKKN